MIDLLPANILIYCILPYLQDAERRTLSILNKKTNNIINRYCLADKSSIEDLCRRGDLLIIYKRGLIVENQSTFKLICERGYINLVKKSIKMRNFSKDDFNNGMYSACQGGHRGIVELMISLLDNNELNNNELNNNELNNNELNNNVNWNWGLFNACYGGHREIIDLMIENGANDWNEGLFGACGGGHREIVDLMIEQGAGDWAIGMYSACEGGHREIVDLMITLLPNNELNNNREVNCWNQGLTCACLGGHREIIDLMIEKGANNWGQGLNHACYGGHREIVDLMITLLENNGLNNNGDVDYWDWGLTNACQGDRREIVELMIKKGATNCYSCRNTMEEHLLTFCSDFH